MQGLVLAGLVGKAFLCETYWLTPQEWKTALTSQSFAQDQGHGGQGGQNGTDGQGGQCGQDGQGGQCSQG